MKKLSQGLEWIGRTIWLLLRVFGFLIIFAIPTIILEEAKSQVALVMAVLLTLGLLIFFWWRAEKNNLPVWDKSILSWDGLAIVLLAFAIMQLTDMLGFYLLELQGTTSTANEALIIEYLKGVPFWLAFLTTACLPAIAEEVLFRGYLFKKLFGSQVVIGIIVSSLLFGALHGPTDIGSWLVYGGGGLIFCILYHKTGYLIYPMAVHFINNAWSVVAFYYFK
ncbi:TPA: lysostaphin resistance A-like protein [Streptococcus suis]